jgi:thiamine-monophosphate kinase
LAGVLDLASPDGLVVGIGDDAAAWQPTPGTLTVATTDALVQDVHFDLSTTSWLDLGWKALAENVSDVAAMGCQPRYALIALGIPDLIAVAAMEELYRGLRACATAYDCHAVGGDVVASRAVTIVVTLLGESLPRSSIDDAPPLLRRSEARPGDVIATTGPLGASAAGLRVLRAATQPDGADAAELVRAHLRPTPRVTAGIALVEAGIRCAIDVSDGLVADVQHICERSGVDAEIEAERVPVHWAARAVFPDAALDLALSGGEDYELVCAGSVQKLARASDILISKGQPPLITIGTIVERRGPVAEVRVVARDGALLQSRQKGYEHFPRT